MNTTPSPRAAGFTLVEIIVGVSLATFAGLAAITLLASSRDGASLTRRETMTTGWLRKVSQRLREDLAQCSTARLTVARDLDQNDVVTVQRPLASGGAAPAWGAYDPSQSAADRMREDCFTRYAVQRVGSDRQLVRQVLDGSDTLLHEEVLARGLADGRGAVPGLRVQAAGAMWRVTIGIAGVAGHRGDSVTFDVALMN
ncbi:MAG: type II secretion system protein J [Planctomycetota bacterium]|jgi:type II secretory pathway pseudopilin PulG